MTVYSFFFYITAALIIASTGLAITRKHMVHAVLYLVVSFVATAVLFYLLGAPLLAILQVIIYAGAIMVVFLFIVMMIRIDPDKQQPFPVSHYLAAGAVCGIYFTAAVLLIIFSGPEAGEPMAAAAASPFDFGYYLFDRHWLSVELISLLLLVALVGALHAGRGRKARKSETGERK
ncbi:MAG: NADH-quinone oxidoreductase subunit J family protein [Thermodesulfobacteriota bacterium]